MENPSASEQQQSLSEQRKSFMERLREKIDEKFRADKERQNQQLIKIGEEFGHDLLRAYGPNRTVEASNVVLGIQSLFFTLGERALNEKDPELQKRMANAANTLSPIIEGIFHAVKPELWLKSITIHAPPGKIFPPETKK